MRTRSALVLLLAAAVPAAAHHGWGSYDASKPVTVDGPIVAARFENPHAAVTVRSGDRNWTVTLAPTSRMLTRGAGAAVLQPGKTISAYGYVSTAAPDEMRAERITVDGKTFELR